MSKDAGETRAGPAALEIDVEHSGEAATLRVRGELDLAAAPALEAELKGLEEETPPLLVVDLRELDFIDSSGLRLLLMASERAREQDRRFVVVRGSPEVDRILEITGADRQLDLTETPPAS